MRVVKVESLVYKGYKDGIRATFEEENGKKTYYDISQVICVWKGLLNVKTTGEVELFGVGMRRISQKEIDKEIEVKKLTLEETNRKDIKTKKSMEYLFNAIKAYDKSSKGVLL